jgi:putative hydrolase of HD superfamily
MDLIEFFREVNRLKEIKRKGWLMDGVENPESVADHSFMTAFMVLVLGKDRSDIDLDKAVKMALVHDIPEVRVGDIVVTEKMKYNLPGTEPPTEKFDQVTWEEKHRMEEDAAREMFSGLDELFDLWKEYQEKRTKEAVFVKDVDKLEMSLQALEYEKGGKHASETLHHYYAESRDKIKDPELRRILEEIIAMRRNK